MGIPGKRFVACLAAAAGLTLLAGCGSSGVNGISGASSQSVAPKITTVADLSAAITKTTNTKNSAKVTMTLDGTSDGQHVTGTGSGIVQSKPLVSDMTMTMTGPNDSGTGTTTGQMEVLLVNNALYIKLTGAFAEGLQELGGDAASKPWIKIDPNGTDPASKAFGSLVNMAQENNDPGSALNKMKSAATITSTKQEQLDGQSTTHYTVTVDLKKYAASLSDTDPEKQSVNEDLQTGVNNQTVDIWVNSENLPLKLVVAEGKTGTVTATYADWGAPASITAPPAAQVAIP